MPPHYLKVLQKWLINACIAEYTRCLLDLYSLLDYI